MDLGKFFLVLCAALVIGIGVPLALVVTARRGRYTDMADVMRKITDSAARPWKAQDKEFEELSRRVALLRKTKSEGEKEDGEAAQNT